MLNVISFQTDLDPVKYIDLDLDLDLVHLIKTPEAVAWNC